jgi:Uma2 family endonuclease
MSTSTKTVATLEDLYRVEGKAELINGRIVRHMPTGYWPSEVACRIVISLRNWSESTGRGKAFTDNIGYAVLPLSSGRESFSPDASYFLGPLPANKMRFLEGPPTFAVEVRSENDYGPAAESAIASKREDYFEAGTAVVWEVDPIGNRILKYTSNASDNPTLFLPGEEADAEPALPGWKISVDQIFK